MKASSKKLTPASKKTVPVRKVSKAREARVERTVERIITTMAEQNIESPEAVAALHVTFIRAMRYIIVNTAKRHQKAMRARLRLTVATLMMDLADETVN